MADVSNDQDDTGPSKDESDTTERDYDGQRPFIYINVLEVRSN